MSVSYIAREFTLPLSQVITAAQRLVRALEDPTLGPPVIQHLPPAFAAEFSAQTALVEKLSADQSGAIGSLGSLVQSKAAARQEYYHQSRVLRRAARLAFPGQGTLLRGEFLVGLSVSHPLPRVLEQGRLLTASAHRYAVELAPHGWSLASTEAFVRTVERLALISRDRDDAGDGKLGTTAERTAAANRLYRQCLAVQNAARLVYAGALASTEPISVEAQARFLLGEFPRRSTPSSAITAVPAPSAVQESPQPTGLN